MFFNLKSYAKLNVFLKICGTEENNGSKYHLLQSLFMYTNLHDLITIKENNTGLNIRFTGKNSYSIPQNNTVQKVCNIISELYKIKINLDISVHKNIPIASGMGGGSSNAGVLINFFNKYYKLNMTESDKKFISNAIGSDVYFFTQNNHALCSRFGDHIEPVEISDMQNYSVLLVKNCDKLSTKSVYAKYANSAKNEQSSAVDISILNIATANKLSKSVMISDILPKGLTSNDLMQHAISNVDIDCFEYATQQARGAENIKNFGMTGAGSVLFFIYDSRVAALQGMYDINQRFKGSYTEVTSFADFSLQSSKIVVGM